MCCDKAVVFEIITRAAAQRWDRRWSPTLEGSDNSAKFLYEHTLPCALYRYPRTPIDAAEWEKEIAGIQGGADKNCIRLLVVQPSKDAPFYIAVYDDGRSQAENIDTLPRSLKAAAKNGTYQGLCEKIECLSSNDPRDPEYHQYLKYRENPAYVACLKSLEGSPNFRYDLEMKNREYFEVFSFLEGHERININRHFNIANAPITGTPFPQDHLVAVWESDEYKLMEMERLQATVQR